MKWSVLGVEAVDKVDDELTCHLINLFKSDSDEIDIASKSVFSFVSVFSLLEL